MRPNPGKNTFTDYGGLYQEIVMSDKVLNNLYANISIFWIILSWQAIFLEQITVDGS